MYADKFSKSGIPDLREVSRSNYNINIMWSKNDIFRKFCKNFLQDGMGVDPKKVNPPYKFEKGLSVYLLLVFGLVLG